MSSSSTSEAGAPASIVFDRVSLGFRPHWQARRQFRKVALDALRGRAAPRPARTWLYRNLSFRIDHGERVGIVGANGAGKSTILKLMVGVYRPTRGYVVTRGRISALIELGAGFNAELSGPENILLAGAFQGVGPTEMRTRVSRILDFAGLSDAGTLPVKYYSSGMMLRLAFSIATDVEPDILLLDEILAVGDAEFAARALQRMRRLLDASHLAVIVSHDLQWIEEFCTRVIWMHDGTAISDGAPRDVCRAYRDHATAGTAAAPHPHDVAGR